MQPKSTFPHLTAESHKLGNSFEQPIDDLPTTEITNVPKTENHNPELIKQLNSTDYPMSHTDLLANLVESTEIMDSKMTKPKIKSIQALPFKTGNQVRCDVCGYEFSDEAMLILHQQLMHDSKPYHCQYCSKAFKMKGSLMIHTRVAHTKFNPGIIKVGNNDLLNSDDFRHFSRCPGAQD